MKIEDIKSAVHAGQNAQKAVDAIIENTEQHRKLTKEELERFAPKCAYCGDPIPEDRLVRRKRTCCDEHTKHIAQFKRFLQSKIRCSSCGRPSSPEEREDFKRWRAQRGEVLKSIGRGAPRKTREKQIESALADVLAKMKSAESQETLTVGMFGDFISTIEKILTTDKPE